MKRAFLQFACIFLLLAGQQGALVHSVWHLKNRLASHGLQDRVGAAHGHQNDGKSTQSRLCDLHSVLGTLLAGDCGGQSAPVAIAATYRHPAYAAAWRAAHSTATPPSRAPPVLL